jgi:hypothetical protein
MTPESSLLCSQELSIGPHPAQVIQIHYPILFL